MRAAVTSRIKIMAHLNIAERRLPQDGRIKSTVRGKDIDLRVSTMPTMLGESVVLRILDRSSVQLDFAASGLPGAAHEAFAGLLAQPNGIILVTGPTGSGKTTTLYTALNALNGAQSKLFTVEDPIEYQLAGVNQIQVQPRIGLTFAHALRSILRQDPDIIMVGEIRDLETAQMAMQASLTGHLVLSTVHTNSAAGTITRLLDMGVEDYLLASTVTGILAQRLVRRLCTQCAAPAEASPLLLESLGERQRDLSGLRKRVGCRACRNTGYRGRTTISELLVMTDAVRQRVLATQPRNRHRGCGHRRRHGHHVRGWPRQGAARRDDDRRSAARHEDGLMPRFSYTAYDEQRAARERRDRVRNAGSRARVPVSPGALSPGAGRRRARAGTRAGGSAKYSARAICRAAAWPCSRASWRRWSKPTFRSTRPCASPACSR